MNDTSEEVEAIACAEFRRRFNGFNDQTDEYIRKHFNVQLELLKEIVSTQAANREKDAEIERLKARYRSLSLAVGKPLHSSRGAEHYAGNLVRRAEKAEAEFSSLRTSVGGEKWIDVKQELPPMGRLVIVSMGSIVQNCLYSWNGIDRCWSPFDEDFDTAPDGTFTFWQPLPAPPSLPNEKE